MKIAVGLSGGIDSSTALLQLHEEGHDVVGITMKATYHDQDHGKCCSIQDVHDARLLCQQIGVRHYVIDVKEEFHEQIIKYFIDEYLKGRTPNPCLFCNELVKFKKLIDAAKALGYKKFATGHYAVLEQDRDTVLLKKGLDPMKDQSYFLSRLPLSILSDCIFPLGQTLKKDNVGFLEERNISISQKRESHEICFVPGNDYTHFVKDQVGAQIKGGDVVNELDEKVGEHDGIPYYTIGQRRGLNIAMGKPVYVREMDPRTNVITIGEKPYEDHCRLSQVNWLADYDLDHPIPLMVKVRHFHDGEEAVLSRIGTGELIVQFKKPVFSITKGQGAVGYLDDRVIFSGIIE